MVASKERNESVEDGKSKHEKLTFLLFFFLPSVGILFTCGFRKDYPNEPPEMNFRTLRGVTPKQLKVLTEKVETHAQELLGMQMLFPLAQLVKDWLDEQNMDNISKQKEASRAKDELEAEKEKEVRSSPERFELSAKTPQPRFSLIF